MDLDQPCAVLSHLSAQVLGMPPSGNRRGLGLTPFRYLPQHDLDLQICKATLGKPITVGRRKKRLANVLPMEWGCGAHGSVHYRSQVVQAQPLGQMPLECAHSFLGPQNGSLMSPIPVRVEVPSLGQGLRT